MNSPKSTCTLEKTGEKLTFEVETFSLNIAPEDEQAFQKNPEHFMAELLKAKGETVNDLQFTSSAMEHILKATKTRGTTWHCETPGPSRSKRIVITIKK